MEVKHKQETTRGGDLDNVLFFLTFGLVGVETTLTYPTGTEILSHTLANVFTTTIGLTSEEKAQKNIQKASQPKIKRRIIFNFKK